MSTVAAASDELSSTDAEPSPSSPSSPSAADAPILMCSLSSSPSPSCSPLRAAAAAALHHPVSTTTTDNQATSRRRSPPPPPPRPVVVDPLVEAVKLIGGELDKGIVEGDILDLAMSKDPLFSLLGWWLEDGFPDQDNSGREAK